MLIDGLLLYPRRRVEMGLSGWGFPLFHVVYSSSFSVYKFNENKKTIRKVGKNLAGTEILRKFAPEYARPFRKLILMNCKSYRRYGQGRRTEIIVITTN